MWISREAYKIIEEEQEKVKNGQAATLRSNITKRLNKSHVGESALIIENTDYAVILNPEVDPITGEEYSVFKLVASRSKKNKLTYFAEKMINGMRMEEDLYEEKPLYLESIGESTLKNFNPKEATNTISNIDIKKKTNEMIKNFNRVNTNNDGEIDI